MTGDFLIPLAVACIRLSKCLGLMTSLPTESGLQKKKRTTSVDGFASWCTHAFPFWRSMFLVEQRHTQPNCSWARARNFGRQQPPPG
ncbi:hypothetical protein B0T09DRAFT_347057 [Sordaria sp. MPI-SDFR-AT-0083]|nr:hypothetical protein B0T09DRAFT_347057 [Sordaria sp. MPI-SDFR-AT-0083]